MDRIFMDEYYEHLRADNIEAFSKERNDEYVGRAEEYKAAKSALLEGLGLEHMEQVAAKTKAGQASPAGTFSMKLGKTTYVVGVHFSQTAKDTLEDKMKRLMKDDVKSSNF